MTINISPNPIFDNTLGYIVGAAYFFGMATTTSYVLSKIPGWVTSAIFMLCFGYSVVIRGIAGENVEALYISLYFAMACIATLYLYDLKKNAKNS